MIYHWYVSQSQFDKRSQTVINLKKMNSAVLVIGSKYINKCSHVQRLGSLWLNREHAQAAESRICHAVSEICLDSFQSRKAPLTCCTTDWYCYGDLRKTVEMHLYRLSQIAVTIPVSSAACERCFSTLKRIKTYLRNSMTDSRLSSLGMLSIESERAKSLNMTTFVDVFAANHKNSRIHLF